MDDKKGFTLEHFKDFNDLINTEPFPDSGGYYYLRNFIIDDFKKDLKGHGITVKNEHFEKLDHYYTKVKRYRWDNYLMKLSDKQHQKKEESK